jgi:hypothetical protein
MPHIYHGKDTLILTDVQKQDFPSGLSRIDATYKCRTTEADNLAPLLAAGNRMPEFPAYVIRQNPTRETGQDGFTTFRSSSFSSTGTGISASTPAVFGAIISQVNIPLSISYLSGGSVNLTAGLPFTVLSDTITRTFTLTSNVSVTTLALPAETLNYKIVSSTETLDFYLQNFKFVRVTYNITTRTLVSVPFNRNNIFTKVAIINVNRATYGGVDEVQCTWGYDFANAGLILVQTA